MCGVLGGWSTKLPTASIRFCRGLLRSFPDPTPQGTQAGVMAAQLWARWWAPDAPKISNQKDITLGVLMIYGMQYWHIV
eukprot:9054672-Heterocapsa_arctica.AAC.1